MKIYLTLLTAFKPFRRILHYSVKVFLHLHLGVRNCLGCGNAVNAEENWYKWRNENLFVQGHVRFGFQGLTWLRSKTYYYFTICVTQKAFLNTLRGGLIPNKPLLLLYQRKRLWGSFWKNEIIGRGLLCWSRQKSLRKEYKVSWSYHLHYDRIIMHDNHSRLKPNIQH